MKFLRFLILILTILIVACNWGPVDPEIEDPTINWEEPYIPSPHNNLHMFPLELGNSWSYKYYFYNMYFERDSNIVTSTIVDTEIINNKKYFLFDRPIPSMSFLYTIEMYYDEYINFPDSLYLRENSYGDLVYLFNDKEFPMFIFNEALIDSHIIFQIGEWSYTSFIASLNDTVEVIGHTYNNCLKILNAINQSYGSEYYSWFVSGLGPIQMLNPDGYAQYNLVNYHINP